MSPAFKEASFPPDYRQAQAAQILAAVYRSRSIAVTGLAGMGKSNVVRFIASHPEARRRYLRERAPDVAVVYVDCASLPANDEDSVLEETLAQLYLEGLAGQAPTLPPAVLSLRRNLRAQVLGLDPARSLVLILDDFDQAAQALGEPFFNYLAHLRNARPRANLSYVFATRRPLGHLYELQELLDDGCVVGPFTPADALASLERDGARLGYALTPEQGQALLHCTGGHPGLLKNAAELVASGDASAEQGPDELARQLLRSPKVRIACADLWGDLTAAEQGVLGNLAQGIPLDQAANPQALAFLRENGLLVPEAGPERVFSPLLAAFVRAQSAPGGQVRIAPAPPNHARIEVRGSAQMADLTPLLFGLLCAFSQAPEHILSREDVIRALYGGGEGVSDEAISQLVKRLRLALDPAAQRMANDPSYTCVETIRGIGFRFRG
ncbi:MAG: AAA family ATPase [Chloroflexi bacterium]|nr:AAA family ATPase [Chloroflexota bacterium]